MDDIVVDESADDLTDGIGFADVREELVAQAFPFGGAAHDSSDVDEIDGGIEDAFGGEDLRQPAQPGVRQRDHAHVRFDRRERVVCRENLVLGQCVKHGRLADIGQSHDSNSQSHGIQV